MYTSFFGLQEKPFAITPDPRYLYLSERHAEALAHLLYGINEAGGFIQLTGEVGTGKTTVIRSLLEQLPGHAEVALILNPRITPAGVPADDLRGTAPAGAGRKPRQHQGADGPARALPARGPCARTPRRADRRRGAEPELRDARAGAPAHEPRDGDHQAAADHPDRPGRTARRCSSNRTCASSRNGSRAATT